MAWMLDEKKVSKTMNTKYNPPFYYEFRANLNTYDGQNKEKNNQNRSAEWKENLSIHIIH